MAQITLNSTGVASSGSLVLQSNGTTAAVTVDTAQNVGIGVTPSAWGSGQKYLEINTGGVSLGSGGVGSGYFRINNVFNGTTETYKSTGAAAVFGFDSGFKWFMGASGTAGNTISFTQAMTLDQNGNFMLGSTSASGRARFVAAASTDCIMNLETATNNYASGIQLNALNSGGAMYNYIISKYGATENWYIGGNGVDQTLVFKTGGTERARIDSSGNLKVGTTVTLAKLSIVGNAGGSNATLYASNENGTSGDYASVFALGANSNNTSSVFLLCTNPSVANRFIIYGNGTYATVSDQRLKKNIETTRNGYLDDLMNLRVVKYNWNSQADGEPKELGVIAQEIEQVFPALVQESKAPDADTAYKQVKTSVLPFMLLKALQELKTEFDAYKASHP